MIAVKESTLTITDMLLSNIKGQGFTPRVEHAEITEPIGPREDINGDGTVNIQDLVLVASNFGKTGKNDADINNDGIVNIQDLVLVAAKFGSTNAAPTLYSNLQGVFHHIRCSGLAISSAPTLTYGYKNAKGNTLFGATSHSFNPQNKHCSCPIILIRLTQKLGYPIIWQAPQMSVYLFILLMERLSELYNWGICRQVSIAAAVVLLIGDGKNTFGEPVASGVYFYTLTAGDFTATRKMLILK